MLDMALFGAGGPVGLKEIAARQDISMDYLEQLLRRLRKAGLVRSIRGPRGGFVLAKPAEEIPLWDVISALEDEIAPVFCVDEIVPGKPSRKRCSRTSGCATHLIWVGLARQMRSYLESKTLRDIADMSTQMCNASSPGKPVMFHI
jgi:Rrf2 family iron-sulfur cluster assembly transcriptional regulator